MAIMRRERFELPEMWRRFIDADLEGGTLRVEEFRDDGDLVVRAEIPGIDPDKDVDLTVSHGVLRIHAQREEKQEHHDKEGYHSEFRYGSFDRSMVLPDGVTESDIKASYADGILDIRVPMGDETTPKSTRIPVSRG